MDLEGHWKDDVVTVGGDARQRFHDARGYGYPLEGNEIALAPVEAAHLLYRDDLTCVIADGDRLDFRAFVAREPGESFGVRFLVYADLRSRGFYLSPAREPWITDPPEADFAVFERGTGPGDGSIEYALQVRGERSDVPAGELQSGVLAIVDEESEITYFGVERPEIAGSSGTDLPTGIDADLLADRVVLWEPPLELYERSFYGQPLEGREYDRPTLQCSLLEAAHLAARGAIDLEPTTLIERGRDVEGERFDRRLAVYERLRERGIVPKTGYKFGADFRTYADVESVAELGHSELLIRVLPASHVFEPRDLALDVRLAHGVRKTMVVALVGEDDHGAESGGGTGGENGNAADTPIQWWSFERLTP